MKIVNFTNGQVESSPLTCFPAPFTGYFKRRNVKKDNEITSCLLRIAYKKVTINDGTLRLRDFQRLWKRKSTEYLLARAGNGTRLIR